MHTQSIERWMHDHTFGQDRQRVGERRTLIVIAITGATMAAEIAAGLAYGSMALLADGLHMGSHASALIISAWAYFYTRRRARDARFNFGTGKVNSLAGFASAVMLVLFALVMAWESIVRLLSPVPIEFNYAILVAVAGLVVNGVCLVVLGGHGHSHGGAHTHADAGHSPHDHDGAAEDDHPHGHHEDHDHEHGPGEEHGLHHEEAHHEDGHDHPHEHPHPHEGDHGRGHAALAGDGGDVDRHKDHNLWSAYLHVMADAMTSVLAISALLAGKYFGQTWLDPFMGIVGAAMVIRWSLGLLRSSAGVLLDMQGPDAVRQAIRGAIEGQSSDRVSDLHVWAVGPGIYSAEIALVASEPKTPDHYAAMLPPELPVVHVTVEVRRCPSSAN